MTNESVLLDYEKLKAKNDTIPYHIRYHIRASELFSKLKQLHVETYTLYTKLLVATQIIVGKKIGQRDFIQKLFPLLEV